MSMGKSRPRGREGDAKGETDKERDEGCPSFKHADVNRAGCMLRNDGGPYLKP